MNVLLARALLLERARSPVRVALAAAFAGWPAVISVIGREPIADSQFGALLLAIVLGAGSIGEDAASGSLHLVLSRPVHRHTVVVTAWVAIAGASFAVGTVSLLVSLAAAPFMPGHPAIAALDVARRLLETALTAGAVSAVMVSLGSIARGAGNVVLWITGFTASLLVCQALNEFHLPGLALAQEGLRTFAPSADLEELGTSVYQWTGLVSCVSTTVLALAFAVVALNRKEMPHAGA